MKYRSLFRSIERERTAVYPLAKVLRKPRTYFDLTWTWEAWEKWQRAMRDTGRKEQMKIVHYSWLKAQSSTSTTAHREQRRLFAYPLVWRYSISFQFLLTRHDVRFQTDARGSWHESETCQLHFAFLMSPGLSHCSRHLHLSPPCTLCDVHAMQTVQNNSLPLRVFVVLPQTLIVRIPSEIAKDNIYWRSIKKITMHCYVCVIVY